MFVLFLCVCVCVCFVVVFLYVCFFLFFYFFLFFFLFYFIFIFFFFFFFVLSYIKLNLDNRVAIFLGKGCHICLPSIHFGVHSAHCSTLEIGVLLVCTLEVVITAYEHKTETPIF